MILRRRSLLSVIAGFALSSLSVAVFPACVRAHSQTLDVSDWSRIRARMVFARNLPTLRGLAPTQHSVSVLCQLEDAVGRGEAAERIAAFLDRSVAHEAERACLVEAQQWMMTPTEYAICLIDERFERVSPAGLNL